MRRAVWNPLLAAALLAVGAGAVIGGPRALAEEVQDVTRPGDPILASSAKSPGSEGVANAIDGKPTKSLNSDVHAGGRPAGFAVTPALGPALVTGMTLQSANDEPDRDPKVVTLEGSNDEGLYSVTATGTPPLAYQWFTNNFILIGATNASLMLANVQPNLAGEYSIVVSDSLGAVTSRVAVLTVAGPDPTTPDPDRWAWIPAGTFTMGSPVTEADRSADEGPQTQVTLSRGFWMGKYEVTQREYLEVMGTNVSFFQGDLDLPVEFLTWIDATDYCGKLTARERSAGRLPEGYEYRLPTEAQWEYACRAGTTTATAFGDSLSSTQANFDGGGPYNDGAKGPNLAKTTKVGSYVPNAWGLYDMHGNVWEWCQDVYADAYAGGIVSDPKGAMSGSIRVYRGGGWPGIGRSCRSAERNGSYPGDRSGDLGFRVALVQVQTVGPVGTHYEFVSAPGISWAAANADAQSRTFNGMPGHLVTLTSAAEHDFVNDLVGSAASQYWAGGYQSPPGEPVATNGWTWVNDEGPIDGTNDGPGYARWVVGEPNDAGGAGSEQYLGVRIDMGGGWNDEASLGNISGYVVEYERPGLPRLIQQPQSQSVPAGGSATFSVVAAGEEPLSYQWRTNAVPVGGATQAQWVLTHVQPSMAGEYSVVIRNAYGAVTSQVAVLTVFIPEPVTITQQPRSQEVSAWSTVTFSVSATGTPPLAYQWQREGTNLIGARLASLPLGPIDPGAAGRYRVAVSNQWGAVTSEVAVLTVVSGVRYVTNLVVVSTLAGSGVAGHQDGEGITARFNLPNGGWVDAAGNVYVADTENHRIRKVTTDGIVSTVAGSGVPGFADGLAAWSRFTRPLGVTVDKLGHLYVADAGNHRIRKVNISDGRVSTLAGSDLAGYRDGPTGTALLRYPNDLFVDQTFNVFFTEYENHTLRRLAPDGTVTTWIGNGTAGYVDGPWAEARLTQPGGIAVDKDGNLFVTEYGAHRIRKVSASGVVSTVAGDGTMGYVDGEGTQARFRYPDGIVVDSQGYLYVTDNGNHAIRRISPSGYVETVAGSGQGGWADGPGSTALFANPSGIGMDPYGALYVTDRLNHRVRRIAVDASQLVLITHPPQRQTVAVGGTAVFTVKAQGVTPLSYGWFKEGEDLPLAQTTSLVLTEVRPNSAGNYWVVVSNAYGSVTSQVVTLTVTQPFQAVGWPDLGHWYARIEAPGLTWSQAMNSAAAMTHLGLTGHLVAINSAEENRFLAATPELGNGTADALNLFWIGATQTDGAPEPAGGWSWVTGEPFTYANWGPRAPDNLGAGENRGLFDHQSDGQAGDWNDVPDTNPAALGYVVEFEPPVGDTNPPVIVSEPKDQFAPVGREATFRVEAASGTPLTYRWTRNGETVSGATNAWLILSGLQLTDAGKVQAMVSNQYGSVTSRVATLSVSGGGQGTVIFANRSGGRLDARVFVQGPQTPPADGRFVAQLYAGRPGGTLEPVGQPVAFAETPPEAMGYIVNGGVVEVSSVGPGQPADVKMVAWLRGYGANYDDARSGGCYYGESAVFTVTTGGGLVPPASLIGLQSFVIGGHAGCTPLPPSVGSVPVAGRVEGHWYQRVDAPLIPWSQARQLAEGMTYRGRSGHLVSITTAEENRFLSDHPQLGNGPSDLLEGYWIGALRPAGSATPETAWRWVTPEAFEYNNWREGQTNEPPGVESHAVFLHGMSASGKQWGLGTEIGPESAVVGYVVEYEGGEPPVILAEPASSTVFLGETATLTVSVSGTAPLAYRWYHDAGQIPGSGAEQATLTLSDVQLWQAGRYWVEVSNPLSAVTSQVATLTILLPIEPLTNVVVSTLAGSLDPGMVDSTGFAARFRDPMVGAVDEEGSVYLADAGNHRIRKVSFDGQATTFAGTGQAGFRDGPGNMAQFNGPRGVGFDGLGNVLVADTENHRIRQMGRQTAEVSTFAGTGTPGRVDGPAHAAAFRLPMQLVSDPEGNVFVSDYTNHVIRRISRDGVVSTYAGTGQLGHQDGPRAAARFQFPFGLALSSEGSLYVSEHRGAHRIRRISPAGEVSTFAGSGLAGFRDGSGLQAQFREPSGMAVDKNGSLFIADTGNHAIRRIDPAGRVVTVAGDGRAGFWNGAGTLAQFSSPSTIAIDAAGVLYVGDSGNSMVRKVQIGNPIVLPPVITAQPQSVTVSEGETVTFRVAATGPPPLSFQWRKNGVSFAGWVGSTLTLKYVELKDAGSYTVLVMNRYASVLSDVANLTIVPPTSPTLVNGDFEEPRFTVGIPDYTPVHHSEVPGWSTTAADRLMKLWSDGSPVPSYSGAQHAEINLYSAAALYQDLSGLLAGTQVGFEFSHRGRNGPESLELKITDLGGDGVPGGADDTVLFQKRYTTGMAGWSRYDSRSEPPILAMGNTLRIAFESLVLGSAGNLLDAVVFGPGVAGALPTDSPPVIFGQPEDQTVAVGETASLGVVAGGGTPLGYLWSRVEAPISGPNPTRATLVFASAQVADSGHYSVRVTNAYGGVTSRVANLFVATTPRPTVLAASTQSDPLHVSVVFSQPMDPASATQTVHYQISDGSPVYEATVVAPDQVVLRTALPMPGWYQVTVSGVRSAAPGGLAVAANTQVPFVLTDGHVSWSLYEGLGSVTNIFLVASHPKYSADWPDRSGFVQSFEFSDDHGSDLIGRLRAFLYPPVSGLYRFALWGDDASLLYLSTDDDPRHKRVIAQTDVSSTPRDYSTISGSVQLEAGRRYYLEAVYLETCDSDGVGVGWQRPGAAAPLPGDPPIPGEYLSSYTSAGRPEILRSPETLTVDVGDPLEFDLTLQDVDGSPPYTFLWWRSGQQPPLPGTNRLSLALPWVTPADDGAQYALTVTNLYGAQTRPLVTVAVVSDKIPPAMDWVAGGPQGTTVSVRFSEVVAEPSANQLQNYTLGGGLNVLAATRQPDGKTVLLETTAQTVGAAYELTVNGVQDLDGNPIAANTRASFPAFIEQNGLALREVWYSTRIIASIDTLLQLPRFRADQPNYSEVMTRLETPAGGTDSDGYGQRLSTWIVPPVSGEYRFTIASDDVAWLFLSRDDRRENLEAVAHNDRRTDPREWGRYPTQTSEPRVLEAGKPYYLEALMTEDCGEDHLAVGWIRPGQSSPEVIGEAFLRLRFDPRSTTPTIVRPPADLVCYQHVGGMFRVEVVRAAFSRGRLLYQWQKNGVDLRGETGRELALAVPVDLADNGARYRCAVMDSADAHTKHFSPQEATLTVLAQAQASPLVIERKGAMVSVRWRGEPGVRLQQSARWHKPDWTDVPGTEGASSVDLPVGAAAGYFRLFRPLGPGGIATDPDRWAWIPAGTFTMGSPASERNRLSDEGPQTTVTISKGFWLGKYEVTQREYLAVMGTNPSYFKGDLDLPVELLSWMDATNYCARLTARESAAGRLPAGYEYRLPTEAQWEYACRAGTTTATAFGDSLSSTQANFDGRYPYNGGARGPYLGKTAKVGSYAANAWGLHDMHGNVLEWCQDWYADAYSGGIATDPTGAVSGSNRVRRGGGWDYGGQSCRSALRYQFNPGGRDYNLGFRAALVQVP